MMCRTLISGLVPSCSDELQLHDCTMVYFKKKYFGVWMVYWWCLAFGNGESLCKNEYLIHINISTELQSDVLLPCSFNSTLLGSDKTADIAVVWSQRNTTSYNLLEILLKGELHPWNNKGGRIRMFPELSESGNFSILLEKVQPYDVGLYSCELFNGTRCRIAYQEIQLGLMIHRSSLLLWSIVGAFAGGIVLLAVFITYLLRAKLLDDATSPKGKQQPQPDSSCENRYTEVMFTLHSPEQP
ncbi:uncharacterized protein LOC132876136 [Neoarius graeffei]|uniref:uncharacterized protein LOC132876136 n=1 Tax=Neoarius graeffei TaxID=443677 RepID=UPI00298BFE66|nr:uncharacterized protein LOC132876136 [Neoarius graeffei]XP_060769407.1 uncharacterized protein LOC132876136 [Neoarius graeffei]XP_060769408.1 uncharacterized protein LOC132876136 [Neoarius graeffei]